MDVIHGVVFVIRLRRSQHRVGHGLPVDDSVAVTQGGEIKPRAGQTGAHRHGGFEPGRGQLPSRKNRRLAVGRFAVSSDLRGQAVRRGCGFGTVPGTGQAIEAGLFRSRRRIAAKVISVERNQTAHPPFENKSSVGTERHVHGLIEGVRFSLRGDLGVSGRSGDRLRGCLPIPVAGANQFFAAVGKHDAQAEAHGNSVGLAVEVKPQRVGPARGELEGEIDRATAGMGDAVPFVPLDAPLDRGNGLDARLGNSPVGHGMDHRDVRQHKRREENIRRTPRRAGDPIAHHFARGQLRGAHVPRAPDPRGVLPVGRIEQAHFEGGRIGPGGFFAVPVAHPHPPPSRLRRFQRGALVKNPMGPIPFAPSAVPQIGRAIR